MPVAIAKLPTNLKRSLIDRCAEELNFVRYGTRKPYYLWADQHRREVEAILVAAEIFLSNNLNRQ